MEGHIGFALTYHQRTNHSYHSVHTSRHYLDWDNRPLPFKIYSSLTPMPMPKETAPAAMAGLDAVRADGGKASGAHIPDLSTLANILFLCNGVHRTRRSGEQVFSFRTASCTGALYHIELYLVCRDLPDLSAGVYHYGAHDHSLRRLRDGDYREIIVRATANEPAISHAPAIVVCTDTFWRNAWKYQAREYRHAFWDDGVILANLLAADAAFGQPTRIVEGFGDDEVNRLLSLETQKEVAISLVAIGRDEQIVPASPPVVPLALAVAPLSQYEVDYPIVREMHTASSIANADVAAWRGQPPPRPAPAASGPLFPLTPSPESALPHDPIDSVILRRGSTREFSPVSIKFSQLSDMLGAASQGVPADYLAPFGVSLNDWYLIVNNVEGLPSGSYWYRREEQALEQLRAGDFSNRAGYLALEQELGRDASVNVYFLADIGPILRRFDDRGYRAAQLEAGILGGKLYIAAYALGLGATGLTFYDDDVIDFFSPHAAGKGVMFLMALGVPLKQIRKM
jgi:SagB-type dehydrogenase family enzyme